MATNTIKYDDPFSFTRAVQDGQRRTAFPFLRNGDRTTRVYSRDLVVREEFYDPPKLGFAKDSDWPDGDPQAYALKDPDELGYVGIGDLIRVPRRYSRIPGQQVSYPGPRYFPIPTVTADFGDADSLQAVTYPITADVGQAFVNLEASAIYTQYGKALYGPIKTAGTRVIGRATAGTFTLTYKASTTAALNWNDSGATIATALNGLASVSGESLVATVTNDLSNSSTGGYLQINWTGATTFSPVTLGGGSLTVNTSNNPTTQISSNLLQTIRLADHYAVTAHGLSTGLTLAVVASGGSVILFSTAYWGSIDANTLWAPNNGDTQYWIYFATYKRTYPAGKSLLLRTRLTEDFYLPGVSAGITSPTDIPIVTGLQNPNDFINALMTLTGWQTYETEGPAFWLDGPIYRVGFVAINLDDIV
jgi:hypothetical protein